MSVNNKFNLGINK